MFTAIVLGKNPGLGAWDRTRAAARAIRMVRDCPAVSPWRAHVVVELTRNGVKHTVVCLVNFEAK